MIWLTIGLAAVISMAALWYVVWPLLNPAPAPLMVEDDRLTELMAQKDTVLKGIKDLEFDYQVGKMTEEDFNRFNQRLRRQAVGLIQQIEQLAPAISDLDEQVEMLINRKHKVKREQATNGHAKETAPASLEDQMEAMVSRQRTVQVTQGAPAPVASAASEAAGFCTECGFPLAAQHKFCASCGSPVAVPASVANA